MERKENGVLRRVQDDVAVRQRLLETGKIRLIPENPPPAPVQKGDEAGPTIARPSRAGRN